MSPSETLLSVPRGTLRPPGGELEFASRLSKSAPAHGHEAWRVGWAGYPRARRGNGGDRNAPADQLQPLVSAALRRRRHVLDREFRRGVGFQRAHVLVVAMMAEVLVVMAAHAGIGVQELRLRRIGLDHRRLHGLGHRSFGGN